MHPGRDQPFSSYYMIVNGEPDQIQKVEEQKDLRAIIDNKLKFVPHVKAKVNKANKNLGIIKNIWIKVFFF